MLDSFEGVRLEADAGKRLGVSLVGSAIVYCLLGGTVVAATAVAGGTRVDLDEAISVELATAPEPAPPPPRPAAATAAVAKAPPPRRRLTAPVRISDGPLAESDAALPDAPIDDEEPPPVEPQPAPATTPAAVAAPERVVAPRPRAPRSTGPIQLPEDATPPVPSPGNRPPAYPEQARSAGVQAVVIAKIAVTESGTVGSIEILRGHPAFDDAVRAALRGWRFTPAMVAGRPAAVYRIIRVPFRLDNLN